LGNDVDKSKEAFGKVVFTEAGYERIIWQATILALLKECNCARSMPHSFDSKAWNAAWRGLCIRYASLFETKCLLHLKLKIFSFLQAVCERRLVR
jgi:hypothetical protein